METKVFMILENDSGSLAIDGQLDLFKELLATASHKRATQPRQKPAIRINDKKFTEPKSKNDQGVASNVSSTQ